jgi:hypothetical protein
VLAELGFQLEGESTVHGRSEYFIPVELVVDEGHEDRVRIRVSDHYAHSFRMEVFLTVDFSVLLDQRMDEDDIRSAFTDAVAEREEYFASADWAELVRGLGSGPMYGIGCIAG